MAGSRFIRYPKGDYTAVSSNFKAEGTAQHAYICTRCKTWQDWVPERMEMGNKVLSLELGHTMEACDLVIIRQIHES